MKRENRFKEKIGSLLEDDKERIIMTGTRVYGPVTKDSDWDVVMRKEHAKVLYDLLHLLNVKVQDSCHIHPSYMGFYFRLNRMDKVQVIVVDSDAEFKAWKDATASLANMEPIKERHWRIATFENFFYETLGKNRALNKAPELSSIEYDIPF